MLLPYFKSMLFSLYLLLNKRIDMGFVYNTIIKSVDHVLRKLHSFSAIAEN